MSEAADEYAARITREYHEWLDEVAVEKGYESAIGIAEANRESVGKWGATWLAKHGITDQNASIVKRRESALTRFEKAETEWRKATGGTLNDFVKTEQGLELYREFCAANAELGRTARPQTAMTVDVDAKAETFEALEKGLTAFCKSKGIASVWTEGLAKFRETDEGRQLSDAHDEASH